MANALISVDDLEKILGNDDVRVVDCRWYLTEPELGAAEYQRGHIPGAAYASLETDLSGPNGAGRHPLPSPETFAATLGRLGITTSTRVVVYDDRGGAIAARLWWMLTNQGHDSTSVLDGGIQAWIAAGHDLSTTQTSPSAVRFPCRPWRGVVDRDIVVNRQVNTILIDSRSHERYVGDEEPIDPKAGHIPGAISLPQAENLTENFRFLPSHVLHSRFSGAGITGTEDVIVHCGSGVTACHNILAMDVAGIERPLLYVGSWSDWSSVDLQVATGETP
jgi:thiosulfate/3-mercaptopyruvate sulfurtransferase